MYLSEGQRRYGKISNWDESKHPRDSDGKFGSGGGGSSKKESYSEMTERVKKQIDAISKPSDVHKAVKEVISLMESGKMGEGSADHKLRKIGQKWRTMKGKSKEDQEKMKSMKAEIDKKHKMLMMGTW